MRTSSSKESGRDETTRENRRVRRGECASGRTKRGEEGDE